MKIDANTKMKTLYKRNYMLHIEKLKYIIKLNLLQGKIKYSLR